MRGTLVLIGLVAALALAACRSREQLPVTGVATAADSADQVMIGVRTLLTERGVKQGELFADTTFVYDENSRYVFRNVRTTFNTPTGAPNGTLTAREGRYDIRQRVLEGFGDVVVVTADGKRLLTPHLRFDQARNLVRSDSAFTLTDGTRRSQGIGFESDPNITRFVCKRQCVASDNVKILSQ
ncbi:MAG: LPS export ABC transporter periplasmic protein LptC [Gemmatimonadota bacterium]|nr:LPS export ABC transporter periplasmic protein LptC [Gemmatimonadota bacterium]